MCLQQHSGLGCAFKHFTMEGGRTTPVSLHTHSKNLPECPILAVQKNTSIPITEIQDFPHLYYITLIQQSIPSIFVTSSLNVYGLPLK